MMYQHVVSAILATYGIDAVSIGDVKKGYRNESYAVHTGNETIINLIVFKREAAILGRIKRADHAARALHEAGMPVRVRFDERLLHVKDGVYAGVYNYLPGTTIPWEAYTKKHIKLIGEAMANMHHVLRTVTPYDSHTVQDELLPLLRRMNDYFYRTDVQEAMESKLRVQLDETIFVSFEKLVDYVAGLSDQHIVHMDMVRGNILFTSHGDDSKSRWHKGTVSLSGVIDFEKSAIGHPLFDLARTLAFLLVDSSKPAENIFQYFLYSGYHKYGKQPLPDAQLLLPLVRLFLIHDFYKFLRHTPYESLASNHHYRRTCALLSEYGMIKLKS